ncbi:MAG: hypothetical protein DRR06_18160 [Gammaproteobacteria bacterium]|nr:MAG: hypothetical protein DRR06_18160 [Gammaproteobacteria bacterium]
MSTLSGRLYADGATLLNQEPEAKQDVTLNYSRLRYISDGYTKSASDELGTSAVVNFFTMPKGARLIEMFATAPTAGVTGEADLGWDASVETDEYGVVLEAADADGFYTSDQFDPGDAAFTRKAIDSARPGYRKLFGAAVQVTATVTEITASSAADEWLLEAYITVD